MGERVASELAEVVKDVIEHPQHRPTRAEHTSLMKLGVLRGHGRTVVVAAAGGGSSHTSCVGESVSLKLRLLRSNLPPQSEKLVDSVLRDFADSRRFGLDRLFRSSLLLLVLALLFPPRSSEFGVRNFAGSEGVIGAEFAGNLREYADTRGLSGGVTTTARLSSVSWEPRIEVR